MPDPLAPAKAPQMFTGNGLTVIVDGDDLVVRDTTASYFGDDADVRAGTDNGVGASGFRYIDHPTYLGVSLPMRSRVGGLTKSPLPRVPWFTPVKVWCKETDMVCYAHVIDLGPTAGLNRGIDLLQGTLAALGLTKTAGLYHGITYRIIGGAKYLPKG